KSAQIREILISESAWEEMTCLFAPSLSLLNRTAAYYNSASKELK
ncbi:porin, partial [Klebsiella pneumoniae]